MRLWHESLIKKLPRQQILGQHREICALRGNGWGKPHSTVNYVFDHHWIYLYEYHRRIMAEMNRRGYNVGDVWRVPQYRGQKCDCWTFDESALYLKEWLEKKHIVYKEHDDAYLKECIDNLKGKNIEV
jgi:uncharacterized protein (TIGR02328 family)